MWVDLFSYASLVEHLGVGIWGCKDIAPEWTVDGLAEAFLTVLDDRKNGGQIQANVERLAKLAQKEQGRDVAAREIAKLARTGYAA